MKNKLLFLFALVMSASLQAQTYTTGVINLSSTAGLSMTAKIEIGTQVTLTFTGPSGRWFALGFNATSMGTGNDVVTVNNAGTLTAFDSKISGYNAPTADPMQNWVIVSDQVATGVRTVIATRALNTGDANDYVFTAAAGSLSLIWARAASSSFSYSYHGNTNRGISSANLTLVPTNPPAPTGSASQTFCAGTLLSQLSANGTAIQWYASPTGGSALNGTTVLSNGVTYYATQTVNGFESLTRLAVTVTINTAPTAPTGITGATHFCYDGSESFSITPVNGATSYVWTTPNGASGSSTGTAINLLFLPSFLSGSLSVTAQNICGQSPSTAIIINQHLAYANTLTISNCSAYSFNGQTYTQSGSYPFQGTTVWGCDSTVTLNLTIHENYNTTETVDACGSYLWNGQSYTQSGNYPFQGTTVWGCDSTVTLNLNILENYTTNEVVETCGSYNWNGQSYFQGGNFSDTVQSLTGCDSIITLDLVIHPIESITIDSTVLDALTWNGQVYTTSGQYTQFFTSANGCDSSVTINLTIQDSGISELEENWFVYPNPLNGNQVLFISGMTSGTFRLINLNGSELRSGIFSLQIDLNDLEPGIYYVMIGSQRKRIVIIH